TGAEDGQAAAGERVREAGGERRLRADHRQVDGVLLGPPGEGLGVPGVDGDGGGEGVRAPVAVGDEEPGVRSVLAQLPEERVLAAAVADDEDLHEPWVVWVRCAFGWEEARRGKPGGEGPGAPGLAGRGPGGREGTVGGGLRGRTPVRGGRRRGRHPRKA